MALPGAALAQETAAQAGGRDAITVTAQRREESLQDVPIAISAFSEADLVDRQISEALDLVNSVPNLIGSNNTGLGSANVYFIRGLGNTESIATFDPPVGTYVDDIYIARQNGNNVSFFDIERVEVARGPQGTLRGRNTTGGSVNVVMRKPSEEFGGFLEAGYGRFDRYTVRGSVDLPMSDAVLTKFSGFYVSDDGFVDNIATGETLNTQEAFGFRADLRFNISDAVRWDLAADYIKDDGANIINYIEGGSPLIIPEDGGRRISQTGLRTGGRGDDLIESVFAGEGLGSENESFSITSNLNWDVGIGVLEVLTSYRELSQEFIVDFFDGGLGGQQYSTGGFVIANDGQHDQFSQEVKFTGSYFDDTLDVIAGGYYFREENVTDFADIFTIDADPSIDGIIPVPLLLADRILENDLDSIAFYGQFDWRPVDRLTLTVGVRWTEEDKDIEFIDQRDPATLPPDAVRLDSENLLAAGIPLDQSVSLITPRFAVEYQALDDVNLFVSATKGFKSGGWNARSANPALLQSFSEEQVWSYEAGFRSQWFNNRVTFNATGFFLDVEDFQIPSAFDSPTGIEFITGNFAGLENFGVELDLSVQPVDGLNLYAAIGLQDADYKDLSPATMQQLVDAQNDPSLCGLGIVAPDCQLAVPVRAPTLTANWGGTYEIPLPQFGVFIRPAVNVRYVGEHTTGTSNLANSFEDGYVRLDAGVTLGDDDGDWTITADCTNCSNSLYIESNLPPTVYLTEPARWFVRARVNF